MLLVLSPQLVLLVKTRIIFRFLNEVCIQSKPLSGMKARQWLSSKHGDWKLTYMPANVTMNSCFKIVSYKANKETLIEKNWDKKKVADDILHTPNS